MVRPCRSRSSTAARTAAYARELQHDQLTRRTMAKAQAAAELQHSAEVKARRQAEARERAAGHGPVRPRRAAGPVGPVDW